MLNPFPILFLAPVGYAILRIVTGFILLGLAYRHFRVRESLAPVLVIWWWRWGMVTAWILIAFEFVTGILFVLGLYTQIAALLTILGATKMLIMRSYFQHPALPTRIVYVFLLAIGLCLLVTGAGAFSFDLPI